MLTFNHPEAYSTFKILSLVGMDIGQEYLISCATYGTVFILQNLKENKHRSRGWRHHFFHIEKFFWEWP